MTPTLFEPPDLDEAAAAWKANCGPASVAALLGLTCADVRPHFHGHEQRGYANPTHVQHALRSLGCRVTATWERHGVRPPLPRFGLVFIQFGGPWLQPGAPPWAAYRYTHWAAVNSGMVYDVNQKGGWWELGGWQDDLLPWLAARVKRCDGTWYFRACFEVTR